MAMASPSRSCRRSTFAAAASFGCGRATSTGRPRSTPIRSTSPSGSRWPERVAPRRRPRWRADRRAGARPGDRGDRRRGRGADPGRGRRWPSRRACRRRSPWMPERPASSIGTAALEDPAFAGRLVDAHGAARIAVAIDVRDGHAVGHGWTTGADGRRRRRSRSADLADVGVETFEVTAIDRDGLLEGPDLELYERLVALERGAIIASGGIASLDDIRAVRAIGCSGRHRRAGAVRGRLDLARRSRSTRVDLPIASQLRRRRQCPRRARRPPRAPCGGRRSPSRRCGPARPRSGRASAENEPRPWASERSSVA